MDVEDKEKLNPMDSNTENQANLQIPNTEQEICSSLEFAKGNESEVKPDGVDESLDTSKTPKDPVEILSNELVIPGKELQNVVLEKEIEHNEAELVIPAKELENVVLEKEVEHRETVVVDCSENTLEDLVDIQKIGETQENKELSETQNSEADKSMEENIQEFPKSEKLEQANTEVNTETSDDVNMECETIVETTEPTKPDEFSIQSSAILSGIVNIQSSVDKDEEATSLNTNLNNTACQPSAATTSGLGLLAQYDSDNEEDKISDTDSVIEVPSTSAKDYRCQVVEINSDSDSDDTDSSDSDVEHLNEIRKTIEKRMEVAEEDEEDEDDDDNAGEGMGKKKHKPKLKVKGEMLLEDLPPIQDLQITVPETECIELGKIHSIVDQLVLVSVLPNSILLDLETVIFLEKGQKVLGEVFDVLGQVADPLYCIRFNSNKQIKEKDIKVGDVVYVAPKTQYTQYVILSSLMKLKGSDASWENDIEPPPRFLDYSDDEQEQMARRQLRNKDRPTDNDETPKRPRTSEGQEQSENRSYTPHHKNRYAQRQQGDDNNRNRTESGNYNSAARPRYNNPNNNQQRQQQQPHQQRHQQPNYHRSSWHSNYYPQQQYQQGPPPSQNYGYNPNNRGQSQQNQSMSQQPPPVQNYPSQVPPMYAMPPMHGMPPYPPPPNFGPQGAGPHMPPPHQLMPNSFSIRPPTLHGMHPQQQFTSPPPPPGAQ